VGRNGSGWFLKMSFSIVDTELSHCRLTVRVLVNGFLLDCTTPRMDYVSIPRCEVRCVAAEYNQAEIQQQLMNLM
jgi:hypothetical protein